MIEERGYKPAVDIKEIIKIYSKNNGNEHALLNQFPIIKDYLESLDIK